MLSKERMKATITRLYLSQVSIILTGAAQEHLWSMF